MPTAKIPSPLAPYHTEVYGAKGARRYCIKDRDGTLVVSGMHHQTAAALVQRLNGPMGAAYRRCLDHYFNDRPEIAAETALRSGHEF